MKNLYILTIFRNYFNKKKQGILISQHWDNRENLSVTKENLQFCLIVINTKTAHVEELEMVTYKNIWCLCL